MYQFTFKSRGHFEESIVAIFSEGFMKNGISVWISPKVSSSISIPLDFLFFFFFATGKASKITTNTYFTYNYNSSVKHIDLTVSRGINHKSIAVTS